MADTEAGNGSALNCFVHSSSSNSSDDFGWENDIVCRLGKGHGFAVNFFGTSISSLVAGGSLDMMFVLVLKANGFGVVNFVDEFVRGG